MEDTLDSMTPVEESDGRRHSAEELPTHEAPAGETGTSLEDEMASETEVRYIMEEGSPEKKHETEVPLPPDLGSPQREDNPQLGQEPTFQEHQDTSFESLPTYLPSSSWLADFDRANVYSRMPPAPKKQNQAVNRTTLEVPTRRRKLELEYREEPCVRKPKERYKPKGKTGRQSLSDHECFITRTFNENIFSLASERFCSRCLAKPGPGLKRKAVPFQQRNQALTSTCDTCKSHKRLPRKGSVPDTRALQRGCNTEGDSSDGSCHAGLESPLGRRKRPLGSKLNWEKNCTHDEAQRCQLEAGERLRHCPHGNAIRELDENLPAHAEQLYWTHGWQTEKSWKTAPANPDGTRSPHLNKHKTSHSQESPRKDTRC
ncbi:uncharacterized protein LOC119139257 [Syngnathus acus]|uniref:uncharacterized protein LOC119139257 n=1 Tax=Syngnathus acus TaxID=161584 RepID=UPI00188600B8|nr:uncharacterized protein LOC119139257 [Syngnathus acus]